MQKEEIVDLESLEGFEMTLTKPYGIGIDTHSKFIYVVVICKINEQFKRFENTFDTDWVNLLKAREWAEAVLRTKPMPTLTSQQILPIHYTIESTGTYHYPVIRAWGGKPSVVNPLLASPSRRKTDALDAKLLAYQNLTGLWPESYVVGDGVNQVRIFMGQRMSHKRNALKISNQINNYILRFGLTAGRLGSVTKSSIVRPIVEAKITPMLEDEMLKMFCPDDFPIEVQNLLREMYEQYDSERMIADRLERKAINLAAETEWETAAGVFVKGKELLENLTSVPGIGLVSALIWLTQTCTPSRFPNAKACSAYCGLDPSLKISAGHVTSTTKRGGNKELHATLTNCASVLVRNHAEPFGKWGYQLYQSCGKWRKACSAVARKLAVALYYVNIKNEPFTYDGYQIAQEKEVIYIDLGILALIEPAFTRYTKILLTAGIYDTQQLVKAYNRMELKLIRGLGQKFYSLLQDFIHNQKKYIELYDDFNKQKIEGDE